MSDVIVSKMEPNFILNRKSLICVVMLFILRIPMLGLAPLVLSEKVIPMVYAIFMIGTYFFTALFIWMERDKLSEYHIDTVAILIFTIGPLWYLYSNLYIRVPMIIMGATLLIALGITKTKLSRITLRSFKWILIGIIIGGITATISSIFLSKQVTNTGMKATFSIIMITIITQLTNAAIFEEPFFRGILWGVLKKLKWKDGWICLTQGFLFWIAHIYYITSAPYSFWIVVPLGSIILGILAWRSRSIGTSMFGHGVLNGLGQILTFYRF